MAAITSLSDFIAILTDGTAQHPHVFIDPRIQGSAATAHIVGQMTSLWKYNKSNGARGIDPTTVAAPSRTTQGALGQANAGSGKELRLVGLEGGGSGAGILHVYDRLLHIGGLSGISTAAQTVGGTITRNTGGVGNQIWVEIYTQIGGTSTTITANYTNQAGVSKTSQAAVIGNTGFREAERIIRIPLADGDTGVQSVQSVTIPLSTGTQGSFGVTIAKPIASGMLEAVGCAVFRDFLTGASPIAPVIETDACIAFAWMAAQTTAPRLDLTLNFVEK